jgi:hypothetical protein
MTDEQASKILDAGRLKEIIERQGTIWVIEAINNYIWSDKQHQIATSPEEQRIYDLRRTD